MLFPLKDKEVKDKASSSVLLMGGKELLKEVKKDQEMKLVVIGKMRDIVTNNSMNDFPLEIQALLDEVVDIVVNKLPHPLPPIRIISHHIEFILGASFQTNKHIG